MNTSELTINLPSGLSQNEVKLLLAIKLYENSKITLGQAAKMSGFSKRSFIEILGQSQIPVFNYSSEELREELEL